MATYKPYAPFFTNVHLLNGLGNGMYVTSVLCTHFIHFLWGILVSKHVNRCEASSVWIFLMSDLTVADGLPCVRFIPVYFVLYWNWYPEIRTRSVDLTQLSRLFPQDGDIIQSPKRYVLNKKGGVLNTNMRMDDVQKRNICTLGLCCGGAPIEFQPGY